MVLDIKLRDTGIVGRYAALRLFSGLSDIPFITSDQLHELNIKFHLVAHHRMDHIAAPNHSAYINSHQWPSHIGSSGVKLFSRLPQLMTGDTGTYTKDNVEGAESNVPSDTKAQRKRGIPVNSHSKKHHRTPQTLGPIQWTKIMSTGVTITTKVPIGKLMQIKTHCNNLGNNSDAVESNDYTRVNSAVAKDDYEKDRGPDESIRSLTTGI